MNDPRSLQMGAMLQDLRALQLQLDALATHVRPVLRRAPLRAQLEAVRLQAAALAGQMLALVAQLDDGAPGAESDAPAGPACPQCEKSEHIAAAGRDYVCGDCGHNFPREAGR